MNPGPHCRHAHSLLRRIVAVWLLVALPAYGLSGTLVQMLGSAHTHVQATPTDPMAGWQDFRRAAAGGSHPHPHSHAAPQRHHHVHADTSVVAMDGGSHGDTSTPAGSAALVFAVPTDAGLRVPRRCAPAWRLLAPLPIASRDPERLERPPRT